MIEQIAKHACVGEHSATQVMVMEYRHIYMAGEPNDVREHPGSVLLALSNGEPVRSVDGTDLFEVIATGELLRRVSRT